jgi:opacity protein-like surface antigen
MQALDTGDGRMYMSLDQRDLKSSIGKRKAPSAWRTNINLKTKDMKALLRPAILLFAVILAFHAHAQPRANTWYGKADAGGSWIKNTELKEVFGPVVPNAEVEFNPGVRFGLGAGYNVTEWFAAEAEIGMNWNEIDSMTGATRLDAMFINVPFLVNAKLQLPNATRFRPYVGAGIGGASSVLDIDELEYGPARIWGSASDVTFAWQGFAGVQYDFNDRFSLGVEYRYLWSDSPSFDIDWGWYWNISGRSTQFGDIETHSVSLTFQYQF